MDRRPEYVPRWWSRGRINRWTEDDPRRVFAWFVAAPIVGAIMALVLLASGSDVWSLVGLATLAVLAQSVIFGPRALRAMRRGRRDPRN